MLSATIVDGVTGEPVGGWHIAVDHHLGGYSGPAMRDHFCQPIDDGEGEFRLVAAPSNIAGSSDPERLGITIERSRRGERYYRARFYVSSDMWQDGTWRDPPCTFCWYENEEGKRGGGAESGFPPKVRIVLRDAP
jgi:hypothetical protein